MRINKPMSMFTDTQVLSSHQAQMLQEEDDTALIEDTGYNSPYDECLVKKEMLSGIS